MSQFFAMAIPIAQGQEEEFHKFINELKGDRQEDFRSSRRKLGVRERAFFQQTPMGGLVIITLEGENPAQALQDFAQGTDSFTAWFLERVKQIHGLDLSAPPAGPLPELLMDSGPVEQLVSAAMHN